VGFDTFWSSFFSLLDTIFVFFGGFVSVFILAFVDCLSIDFFRLLGVIVEILILVLSVIFFVLVLFF
jgi:hypothetical protein